MIGDGGLLTSEGGDAIAQVSLTPLLSKEGWLRRRRRRGGKKTPEASVFVMEQRVSGKKQGFLDPEPGCIVTEQSVFVRKQCWFMKKQRRFAAKPHCFLKNRCGFAPM